MSPALFQFIVPPLWFFASAVLLYFVACLYFHLLAMLGGRSSTVRVLIGSLLWLAVAAIGVAPLFGWLAVAQASFPALLEFPALLWPLLCFGLCFLAIGRALRPRLRQLQSMGFFKK